MSPASETEAGEGSNMITMAARVLAPKLSFSEEVTCILLTAILHHTRWIPE